jgi:hypothetical protein
MEGSIVIDGTKWDGDLERTLQDLPDDLLAKLAFNFPWQYDTGTYVDPDFGEVRENTIVLNKEDVNVNRSVLQQMCWTKSIENPQINTSVRGTMGRINGLGFEVSCDIPKIQDVIDEEELDPRNRLYLYYPKLTARAVIEGELFICFTVHADGFIEVDFVDPSSITGGSEDGIIFHPNKASLPLVYNVDWSANQVASPVVSQTEQIPSIFIARYPEWLEYARKDANFNEELLKNSKNSNKKFKKIGGFFRFIVSWDKSFLTRRNVSHLRTTLKWLSYYENLKEYEIDHKKSSGAYVWVVEISDAKAFRAWLTMSAEQKRLTGIGAKKTPGSTMVLPPGMALKVVNPQLPKISDSDTDILGMAISGLNEPGDVTMGTSQSTFASVKASRGPMSDRNSDEICWYEKFLRYDFWGNIFFLRSAVSDFPSLFKVKQAVDFKKKKEKNPISGQMDEKNEPVFESVQRKPERLLEINFPTSEVNDAEASARALLGVKHGSTNDVLGIPNSEIAKKMGFGNYRKLRLQHASEADRFPNLVANMNAEAMQEKLNAEPPVMNKPGGQGNEQKQKDQGQGQEGQKPGQKSTEPGKKPVPKKG